MTQWDENIPVTRAILEDIFLRYLFVGAVGGRKIRCFQNCAGNHSYILDRKGSRYESGRCRLSSASSTSYPPRKQWIPLVISVTHHLISSDPEYATEVCGAFYSGFRSILNLPKNVQADGIRKRRTSWLCLLLVDIVAWRMIPGSKLSSWHWL